MPQEILVWHHDTVTANASVEEVHTLLQQAHETVPEAHAETGAAASAPPAQSSVLVWHDLEGDPQAYGEELARLYSFTPLTLDMLGDEHGITKLRQADGYFHLVMHGLRFDAQRDEAGVPKLDVLFAPHFLVTVHCDPLPWLGELRESIASGTTEENVMSRGMAYLLYVLLDTLVDSYFPVLDTLDDVIDELENTTVRDTSNAVQARLFRIKRMVALMRRVISPQVEVCNALVTRTGQVIPQPMEPYFTTIHDHMVRAFDVLDSYRDLLSGLLDVYLTTVSNRLNTIMKQLTIIATIFLPITFVTGVFGQNFGVMPQVVHDRGYNFWYALLFMALVTAAQLWYFKRRGWI